MSANSSPEPFVDTSLDPHVRGFLHRPVAPSGDGLVLTHGAGSNSKAPLLVALAEAFAGAGVTVLRCDLPYRQSRSFGPPRPGDAARDREGLKNAVSALRKLVQGACFSADIRTEDVSRRCSAPMNQALQTACCCCRIRCIRRGSPTSFEPSIYPTLQTPALFVQGTRDPFGSPEEVESALSLIPAKKSVGADRGCGPRLRIQGDGKAGETARARVRGVSEVLRLTLWN